MANEGTVGGGWTEIKEAAAEGTAEGLRLHLPGTIGLLAKGSSICLLMAFVHFVLGSGFPLSILVGGFFGLAGVNVTAILRWLDERNDERGEDERGDD